MANIHAKQPGVQPVAGHCSGLPVITAPAPRSLQDCVLSVFITVIVGHSRLNRYKPRTDHGSP